ncbi:hypothetical protein [Burkholderia oklahomensis]|uniref:Uncharacterized protein n=1 Tax=Burkholderia oklahomensis TaxID=342113 RepID=A0AAI8BDE2_9BURK|nr:hypothetical protein [Burkholderia oklahomensis]AIO69954.1 hypothetical protein DM82_4368 [Burkholderia oklahomensis]AOI40090.1 hypothetical protein WG70_11030 [Burkholderia oklahomensis EO147]KUY68352.1 hypothetical protein WG70_25130 [Burkholderia oklahomensis EO147]QPS39538.1 hypothetical protein I6G57_27260 [Burkholderia oklahomensis]
MSGFQAWTDTGFYQIDGDTINFGFRQRNVLTTSEGGAGAATQFHCTCQYQFSAVSPILAVYAPGTPVALLSFQALGNNTWLATLWSYQATTFDVYVFDRMSNCPVAGPNVGLQCWSATGELVADTRIPFMNVLGFPQGNIPARSTQQPTGIIDRIQYSFGVAKVATVFGATSWQYITRGYTNPQQKLGKIQGQTSCWMHSGGTAYMCYVASESTVLPIDPVVINPSPSYWSGILVDVSHI